MMKTTNYFKSTQLRPDRSIIKEEWIIEIIDHPIKKIIQEDGRVKIWGKIKEMDNRYLRVILLEDEKTVHNAFFDRRFKE